MMNYPHAYYLKYFLSRKMNVLLWNYRGYGLTKGGGNPTPENMKTDIHNIHAYLREQMHIKGKMGVYGRSIGGIPAASMCH